MFLPSRLRSLEPRRLLSRARRQPCRGRRPLLEALEERRLLATIVVNNLTDTTATGEIDLRQAIGQANSDTSPDTITFDSSLFTTPQTITLTQNDSNLAFGPTALVITSDVTIDGPAGGVTISGNNTHRVFAVASGATLTLQALTVSGGHAQGAGGGGTGGGGAGLGGAVFNAGTLNLIASTLTGNTATGGSGGHSGQGLGGAVFNLNGTVSIVNATLASNTAAQGGGGIYNLGDSGTGNVSLTNTILAYTAGVATDFQDASINVGSVLYSGTNNLIKNNNGFTGGAVTGQDPLLGPLASNGGPTHTMALLPGSPAINAGVAVAGVTTDQRGFPLDSPPDIGAFQVQVPTLSPTTLLNGTYGTAYSQTITATETAGGAGAPYTFAITAGTLPTDLSLTTGGTLSGVQTATGPFSFTVTATDSSGYTGSQAYTLTVNALAVNLTGSRNYDGTTTAAAGILTVSNAIAGDTVDVASGSGTLASKDVGSPAAITSFGTLTLGNNAAGDYTLTGATGTVAITPQTVTASIIGNPTKTYDGTTNATLTPANFRLSGLIGTESFTVTQTAGTYNSPNVSGATTVTASLSPSNFTPGSGTLASDYNLPTTASGAGQITKANAVISVTPYSVTYDGNAHTATGTATGVESPTPANLTSLLTLTGTTHTSAGTYNGDAWSFAGNGNYNATSGTVNDSIAKATTGTIVTSSANPAVYGQQVTFTATVTNTSSGSTAVPTGTVQFVVDGNNFGAPVAVNAIGHAVSLPDTFLSGASHTVQADYTNSDGNFTGSNSTNLTQTVQTVAVEPDPSNPALTDLFIGSPGATSNDQIQVNPVGSSSTGSTGVKVQTSLNGVNTQTTYSQSFTNIYAFLQGGNDNVQLASTLTINAIVTAGNGNDNVTLGNGNNTVTLGNGNDNVTAGNGNNVVLAGTGNDNIQAGTGTNTVTAGAVGSTGNIQVQLGNGANNLVTLLGNGNDQVQVGNGAGDDASITGNGNDQVKLGDGAGDNASITGNGNDLIQVGNGNNDKASIAGNGNDQIQVGNGTGDSVSLVGNGNDNVQTGTGSGTVHIAGTGKKTLNLGKGWTQI